MEHVVFFTGADGAALFRRTPSLQEAVRFVEHLRNVEGVEDSKVFSLAEVPLAFKTVYRVEIPGQADDVVPTPAPAAPLPPMPVMPDLGVAESPAEPVAEPEPVHEPEPVAEPVAEAPAEEPADSPEPVLAAVPSEPYAVTAAPAEEPQSNGKHGRGMGFFSR